MSAEPVIRAAGGVVLRGPAAAPEVLVVHRVRHADWSLPKGKLDPGETPEQAAIREVEEETGVRAELVEPLPSVTYPVEGGVKHVSWWRMRPVRGDPADRPPDDEVDLVRWLPLDDAHATLSYTADRDLLRTAVGSRTIAGAGGEA